MRFGFELGLPMDNGLLSGLTAEARAAETAGFDLLWIDAGARGLPAHTSLALAAALAPHVDAIAVAAVVDIGDHHPIYVAEEVAVADQLLNGRLITCVRPASGHEERFTEAVDVLLAGLAPRSFRHQGTTWQVPANLPANRFNIETRLRVTPTTAQIEPAVWVTGRSARSVAASHGLSYVAASARDGAEAWPELGASLGRRALRLRRPVLWPVAVAADGGLDVHGLADALAHAQGRWGLDTAVLTLADGLDEDGRREVMWRVAHDVRPRVQLDRLPHGLVEYWDSRMAERLAASTRSTPSTPTRGGDDG